MAAGFRSYCFKRTILDLSFRIDLATRVLCSAAVKPSPFVHILVTCAVLLFCTNANGASEPTKRKSEVSKTYTPVPEPSTFFLVGTALIGLSAVGHVLR